MTGISSANANDSLGAKSQSHLHSTLKLMVPDATEVIGCCVVMKYISKFLAGGFTRQTQSDYYIISLACGNAGLSLAI